jgi:hypothetical protein
LDVGRGRYGFSAMTKMLLTDSRVASAPNTYQRESRP